MARSMLTRQTGESHPQYSQLAVCPFKPKGGRQDGIWRLLAAHPDHHDRVLVADDVPEPVGGQDQQVVVAAEFFFEDVRIRDHVPLEQPVTKRPRHCQHLYGSWMVCEVAFRITTGSAMAMKTAEVS